MGYSPTRPQKPHARKWQIGSQKSCSSNSSRSYDKVSRSVIIIIIIINRTRSKVSLIRKENGVGVTELANQEPKNCAGVDKRGHERERKYVGLRSSRKRATAHTSIDQAGRNERTPSPTG